MKIIQIHNKYRHHGGEDIVVKNEYELLKTQGEDVEQLFFDNTDIGLKTMFFNNDSYRQTAQKIDAFLPDIVHVHNIFYKASPSVLKAAKDNKVPVVMTLHNYRLLCANGLFLRDDKICLDCKDLTFPYHGIGHGCFQNSKIKSTALVGFIGGAKLIGIWKKYVDRFIVLTPFIKDLLLDSSLGLDPDQIVVKPNSTDDLLSEGILGGELRKDFVFVGRLSREKGIDFLVDAFNRLSQHKLHIIGDGDLKSELEKKSGSNIIFHGRKDKHFVSAALKTSRALIFPSIWYEGLPNTIIESFSAGTPVIFSNNQNLNGIVTKGYDGESFEPKDFMSFTKTIDEFLSSKVDFQNNARNTFAKKYSHQVNQKNLLSIYKSIY